MERVGFIGLGRMGTPMAMNLAKADYRLTVYNRTPQKAEPLKSLGASVASSPKELAESSEIIITMLSDFQAVRQVILGERGVLEGARRGSLIVDMSTIAPREARELAAAVEAKGLGALDAPVSGSVQAAYDKRLIICAGGRKEAYERCLPVFQAMGKPFYIGPNGFGSSMKLVLQTNLAVLLEALCESLLLGVKAGIDPRLTVEILNSTASNRSGLSEAKGPLIASGNFHPTFALSLMCKDLELIHQAAGEMGARLPAATATRDVFRAALAQGLGEKDYTAVFEALKRLTNAR